MEKIKDMKNKALRIIEERMLNGFFGSTYQEDLKNAEVIEHKDFVEVRGNNRSVVYLVRFLNGNEFDSEFLDFDIKKIELNINSYDFTRTIYSPEDKAECISCLLIEENKYG